MPRLLVTNPENEFVGRLVKSLTDDHGVDVQAWEQGSTGTHVLISMPTDDGADERALAVIDSLDADQHILFIANELEESHLAVIDRIKASGNPWTVLHPVAMMDFSFAAFPPQISMAGVIFGISGRQPVGFVAASDVMRVLARIAEGSGHEGQEYVLTGPTAVNMPSVVADLSQALGWGVDYIDLPEDELKTLMVQYGRQDPDMIERLVFTQLRAWRDGIADVVTSTVEEITGQAPMSVGAWFAHHRADYPKSQSFASKAAGKLVRARYRDKIMK